MPAMIGTPFQRLLLRFDLNSDRLWVFEGAQRKNTTAVLSDFLKRNFLAMPFDSKRSTSFENTTQPTAFNYSTRAGVFDDDVRLSGWVVRDAVNVDGVDLGAEHFASISAYNRDDQRAAMISGLFGMRRLLQLDGGDFFRPHLPHFSEQGGEQPADRRTGGLQLLLHELDADGDEVGRLRRRAAVHLPDQQCLDWQSIE
ncbi:hypothetical protein M3Y99_01856300 [Aphelenchoides fujianensis]|nr:hypothetical protein M3Y99_01856300 [Aphelenchoides fujianensis]